MPDTPQLPDANTPLDGIYTDPYTGEVSLPPNILEQLRGKKEDLLRRQTEQYAQAEAKAAADHHMQELLSQGYRSQSEASELLGMKPGTLHSRTIQIKPDGDYLPDGQSPKGTPGELTVKGSQLRWKHPHNATILLLAPSYVEGMKKADETQRSLEKEGYYLHPKAQELIGIESKSFRARTNSIKSDVDYTPDGQPPKGIEGEVIVKGSNLRWQHPYDFRTILLAPSYVEGMKKAEEMQKSLEKQGYRLQLEAHELIGIEMRALGHRTRQIKPDADYTPDGQRPKGIDGEVTVKGSQLRWQNPYNPQANLLAPTYIEGMKKAEEIQRSLEIQGYQAPLSAADSLGILPATLNHRIGLIKPDADYLPDGQSPKGTPGEVTVKGSELKWEHPYNSKVTLLAPAYVERMKSADEIQASLQKQGFRLQPEIASHFGIDLEQRTRAIKPDADYLPDGQTPKGNPGEVTVKGSQLRWKHPYNPYITLLAPAYVEGMKKAEETQKILEEKGYQIQAAAWQRAGINGVMFTKRTSKIKPEGDYLKNGQLPTGAEGEVIVKGSELRWQHPYNPSIVLLSEEYINAVIADCIAAKNGRVQKGATTETLGIIPENDVTSDLVSELDQREKTHEAGNELQ